MTFPSPVGGIPLPSELGACILFILLYACLLPLVVRILRDKHSRTFVCAGIIMLSIERIVMYILRAVQTQKESLRLHEGLTNYQQTVFGVGYVGISLDMLAASRCLLVNASYGLERYPESPAAATRDCFLEPPSEGDPDRPRERRWLRRIFTVLLVVFLTALVLGIVANATYFDALDNESKARRTYVLRYVSAALALIGIAGLSSVMTWSYMRQPRVGTRGVLTTGIISALVTVVASYRLAVIRNSTTALDSMEPGSLNTPSSKVVFYLFNAAPEWIMAAVVLTINIRKTYGTGPFGDGRSHDETTAEKEQRLERERKRADKKGTRRGTGTLTEATERQTASGVV
ncbi:hypothetical protein BKA70DRAFT_1095362 [Coprinopsis sp. MPI-PUGE-AT-0042]|nr:hypothetical protein BKA70DRAFT_1095362 [Coprinopsis sp. MPI-PUGE-AT-0042]